MCLSDREATGRSAENSPVKAERANPRKFVKKLAHDTWQKLKNDPFMSKFLFKCRTFQKASS